LDRQAACLCMECTVHHQPAAGDRECVRCVWAGETAQARQTAGRTEQTEQTELNGISSHGGHRCLSRRVLARLSFPSRPRHGRGNLDTGRLIMFALSFSKSSRTSRHGLIHSGRVPLAAGTRLEGRKEGIEMRSRGWMESNDSISVPSTVQQGPPEPMERVRTDRLK
jgi:hypothetical protein